MKPIDLAVERERRLAHANQGVSVYVIDDQFTGRKYLEELVRSIDARISVNSFDDPRQALTEASRAPPHLVLTDYLMPQMDGIEFTRRLRETKACADVPLVMITVDDNRDVLYRALESGATDFLRRPIDHMECRARCRNLITMHEQRLHIQRRASKLQSQVDTATSEIRDREAETLLRLAKAGDYRDRQTGNHVLRMARYARLLAEAMWLPEHECEEIELAAPMHDIGKIGIPDEILLKQGPHTPAELEIMRTHTMIGYDILKDSPSRYLQLGAIIALRHHERFDGTGYPDGLAGEDIPMAARIVAVADAYDALTSARPYKAAWGQDHALAYIEQESGKHFDPACVAAFKQRIYDIRRVEQELKDSND